MNEIERDLGNGWREISTDETLTVPRTVYYRGLRRWWRQLRRQPISYTHQTETETFVFRASVRVKGGPVKLEMVVRPNEAWPGLDIGPASPEGRMVYEQRITCLGRP